MNYTDFGRRVREERTKLGLTQEKLAEDVNLSSAYIGQVERGERCLTLENTVEVANRLGVTVDYLLAEAAAANDVELNLWFQLMDGRSEREKKMAINVVKAIFNSLDEKEQKR